MPARKKENWEIEVAVLYFPTSRFKFRGRNFVVQYNEGRKISKLDATTNYGLKLSSRRHNNIFFKHFIYEVR